MLDSNITRIRYTGYCKITSSPIEKLQEQTSSYPVTFHIPHLIKGSHLPRSDFFEESRIKEYYS